MKDKTKHLLEEAQCTIEEIKSLVPFATRHRFCDEFPEYLSDDGKTPSQRLNNLWYGKATNKMFNEHLNKFLEIRRNGKD